MWEILDAVESCVPCGINAAALLSSRKLPYSAWIPQGACHTLCGPLVAPAGALLPVKLLGDTSSSLVMLLWKQAVMKQDVHSKGHTELPA